VIKKEGGTYMVKIGSLLVILLLVAIFFTALAGTNLFTIAGQRIMNWFSNIKEKSMEENEDEE